MGKIKLQDIKQEVESIGWTLLSTQYKNLDTELEFQCNNGHKVYTSLKKFRTNPRCVLCDKQFITKNLHQTAPRKAANTKRILALDDATQITGYSILDNTQLIHYGKVVMNEPDPIERIMRLRQWLISMIENWKPDIIAVEDIQLQQYRNATQTVQNVKTFKRLAQLQGTLLVTILEANIEAVVVPPATWRSTCGFVTTTRNDQKRQAQRKVKQWYDISATQDESDAICIGYHVAKKYYKNNYMINWGDQI